ncbi:MAG TPA: hypothetical protein VHK69_12255, partial [Chitinophagaceae bacterium]|nr:hypothetical protein [Chitinophagaceae bacterium]
MNDTTALSALRSDPAFWYATYEPAKKKKDKVVQQMEPPSRSNIRSFQTVLWVLIIVCFSAVIIWFLAAGNVRLFRKRSHALQEEEAAGDEDIFT